VKQLDVRIANVRQRLRETLTARRELQRGRADELQRSITQLRQEQAAIPRTALEIARMEREVKVSERIFSLLKEKHQEALIKEKELLGEVSLVRPAVGPLEPINAPRALPKAAVGLVIGLIVGFVLAFVVEGLDTSIGAIDEVESLLETSVLGVIPYIDVRQDLSEEKGAAVTLDKETEEKYAFLLSLFLPESRIAEAFRVLRTNLLFSRLGGELKTLMVTSSTQTEGKTTVAINLAIVLGQLGKRTLLVEADLRNPFLHHAFGIPKDPGLTEVLIGSAKLEEAIRSLPDFILGTAGVEGLIDRRGLDNLFLLPSGHQPPNPTEFLSAEGVTTFLADMRQRYDYVILDCAPILPVADPAILGSRVDGTLVIVRVGTAARAALRRAKTLLEAAHARVVGVCLTGVKAEVSPDYAEMAYYRYRYGDHKKRPAPSQGWASLLTGGIDGKLKRLALLLPPLVALGMGIWAWSAGHLSLPVLSANSVESLRAVLPPDWVPAPPGRRNADLAPPVPAPHRQPSEPSRVEAPKAGGKSAYSIRLPGFPTEGEAQRAVARYRAKGLPAFSAETRSTRDGRRWRVFVGDFKNPDEAEVFGLGLILRGEAEEFQVTKNAPGS
jgi:Mrp family chromosome partitioning ATPase